MKLRVSVMIQISFYFAISCLFKNHTIITYFQTNPKEVEAKLQEEAMTEDPE